MTKIVWDNLTSHEFYKYNHELTNVIPYTYKNIQIYGLVCFVFFFSCSIAFIDFEGRSDGESVKRIISIVKPRQLVSG